MTEYWVSQAKHWCDACKCWMPDTAVARANHEKGTGHKLNVQRKLREMRRKAEQQKQMEVKTKQQLKQMEAAAERAYQQDLKHMEDAGPPMPPPDHPPPPLDVWTQPSTSEYLYNKDLKYYYDQKTGFYYGGDPPSWTQTPDIPKAALYENMHPADSQAQPRTMVRGELPENLKQLGGHQAPLAGTVTRGVVTAAPIASKRARDDATASKVSEKEVEERRKREEAKRRVETRTAASFGLS